MNENGCSLEDCYTNLFALTELLGIKYRRLNAKTDSSYTINPLDDPVLISYSKCIQADILCVWRKQPRSSIAKNLDQNLHPKELWIFWYGDEPASLQNYISTDLYEIESGTWETGLSYDCRTLLFKALHNLIERCLLSQNYVRVGKWFVQPYPSSAAKSEKMLTNMSISFNFFLHGESTVCASIDVRQHPPLYNLQPSLISHAMNFPHGVQVLLAPYGLSGFITGRFYTNSDHRTSQLLEEWRRFYCIQQKGHGSMYEADEDPTMPAAVEVIVAGVKMRYPVSYVLLSGETEAELNRIAQQHINSLPTESYTRAPAPSPPRPLNMDPRIIQTIRTSVSNRVIEKSWQDSTITSGIFANSQNIKNEQSSENEKPNLASVQMSWNFSDPTQKTSCYCARIHSAKRAKWSNNTLTRPRAEKPPRSRQHNTAYHRKCNAESSIDIDFISLKSVSLFPNSDPRANMPPESPSFAPSPLSVLQNQQTMIGNNSGDPTMPTLSPHPPLIERDQTSSASFQVKNEAICDTNFGNNCFNVASQNVVTNTKDSLGQENHVGLQGIRFVKAKGLEMQWFERQMRKKVALGIKRPVLSLFFEGEDDEELNTSSFYSIDSISSRLDNSNIISNDLSKLNNQTPTMSDPYLFVAEEDRCIAKNEVKEVGIKCEENQSLNNYYEMNSNIDHALSPSSRPRLAPTLMRDIDLIPHVQDLEKLFDSDNDAVDDPNTPVSLGEEGAVIIDTSKFINTNNQDVLTKELNHMYPTPPSCDNQISEPSPCNEAVTEMQHERKMDKKDINNKFPHVHKMPIVSVMPTSHDYDPIVLPEGNRILPPHLIYKQSSHFFSSAINQLNDNFNVNNQISFDSSTTSVAPPSNRRPIDSPPSYFGHNHTQQRTPVAYELTSPQSNASSINRNLSSMDNSQSASTVEINSLIVNIALSDSILNIFRDQNFDSCTICVCNMNIEGNDIGSYLHAPSKNRSNSMPQDDQIRCTCAFSAIVNRRYGLKSGLFYEEEVEIMGFPHPFYGASKPSMIQPKQDTSIASNSIPSTPEGSGISVNMMSLMRQQFTSLFPSLLVLKNYNAQSFRPPATEWSRKIEMRDFGNACLAALDYSRQMSAENCNPIVNDNISHYIHNWPYHPARINFNSSEVVRLLRQLQPYLNDALQKKRLIWENVYNVAGPLTWKDFHLLAGRGAEESSKPRPIPHLLVGYEQDCLSVSPLAIKYWDKLVLEPYSEPRDVMYVVISPDNEYVIQKASSFFSELSVTYEHCQLGRHRILIDKLRNGILRVGKKSSEYTTAENEDKWFQDIGSSTVANKLRYYSRVCTSLLCKNLKIARLIRACLIEKKRLEESNKNNIPNPSPSPLVTNNSDQSNLSFNINEASNNISSVLECGDVKDQTATISTCDSEQNNDATMMPNSSSSASEAFVVIYIVDPFVYDSSSASDSGSPQNERLALMGLYRCFLNMVEEILKEFTDTNKPSIQLQIIPQHTLLETSLATSDIQEMKKLCMSVYAACQTPLRHNILAKSLTGFGPAAAAEKILPLHTIAQQLYTPPFIIAPSLTPLTNESWGDHISGSSTVEVLLVAYCLSEDQNYLLATATDSHGEVLTSCTINIEVPNKNRRRVAVRRQALFKLWEFVLGVVMMSCRPWRIIIGRFGRLGHGELKGWATILNKKHLGQTSSRLKCVCRMCQFLSISGMLSQHTPVILSACLISMEMHPSLHIMLDCVRREENQSSRKPVSTPRDASVTHILVFPTSATAQASQPVNPADTHMDAFAEEGFEEFGEDIISSDEINDIFNNLDSPNDDKGLGMHQDEHNIFTGDSMQTNVPGSMNKLRMSLLHAEEEEINSQLSHQPQALGFYISTAPTGPLPQYIWSSCPHKEDISPVCFKSSLHIHCPGVHQNHDDLLHHTTSTSSHAHPLDSNLTSDVLRYVLELYNELSWLTIDASTNDRRSCLPSHILSLMQLYHGFDTFI